MKKNQIQFHPSQSSIAKDTHRFRVVNCGRRFGKTFLAGQEMVARASQTDNAKIAYFAPTFGQARDILWQELKKIAEPIIVKINESRLEIIVRSRFPKRDHITNKIERNEAGEPYFGESTSQIMLRGWESVSTIRGQSVNFLVLDEVSSMKNFNTSWKEDVIATLTDHSAPVLFLSTPNGFDHFYDLYNLEASNSNYKSFHFTSYDNPHIKNSEIDELKQTMTDDEFAQEYMADFRKRTGLVYKDFQRNYNVFDPRIDKQFKNIRTTHSFIGIDFGYTNPSASLLIKKDQDSNYWITDELYETNLTNTQLISRMKQTPFKITRTIYADPAEPDRIQEFKRAGFYMQHVIKGQGSIVNGVQRLQELLKTGRIRVSNTCKNLIAEFETYHYPEKTMNHNDSEKPIDEDNHALDALRYALTTHDPHSHSAGRKHFGESIGTRKPIGMAKVVEKTRSIFRKVT